MYVQHDFLSLKITIKYLIQRIYSKFTRICISKTASIVRVAGGASERSRAVEAAAALSAFVYVLPAATHTVH